MGNLDVETRIMRRIQKMGLSISQKLEKEAMGEEYFKENTPLKKLKGGNKQ